MTRLLKVVNIESGRCAPRWRLNFFRRRFCHLLAGASLVVAVPSSQGGCAFCDSFDQGVTWGNASVKALTEASGIAASARNPGVFWTHNDGARRKIYAVSIMGGLLATFDLNANVDDVEDIAVGPGPVDRVSYLYAGDIGGSKGTNNVRPDVRVLRVPEPAVDLHAVTAPRSYNFTNVESFRLAYPDGSYDAESLMVDPVTGDVLVATKQTNETRVYRANLTSETNSSQTMEFVCSIPFVRASGGDISADGSAIVLRREDFAMLWARCTDEPIADALSREGQPIPVVGPPLEPNGEGIGFLKDGSGYVTISEGQDPAIYFFGADCPSPPNFVWPLLDSSIFAGGTAVLIPACVGYPAPNFTWKFNDTTLPNETNAFLEIPNVTIASAGQYEVTASNSNGVSMTSATLTVRPKPDLRITEVESGEASGASVKTADWWELTSFESEPVDLSRWRFNDNAGGLTDPYTISTGVVIHPGESVIFAEGLSRSEFINWWGATNLPTNIQVITYPGNGLGLGASGDGLRLWNDAANDANDTVASVDFGVAEPGVTFNYDPVAGQFGIPSGLGTNGVFKAAKTSDIGSPGRIIAPAISPFLGVEWAGENLRIGFEALFGHTYSLETSSGLEPGKWVPTGDTLQATNNMRLLFEKPQSPEPAFYRVVVE